MKTMIVVAALVLILPMVVFGQNADYERKTINDPEILKEARHIYNQIMSPWCPGKTLSVCTSSQAEALRLDIRKRLALGETADEIFISIVEELGPSVLAAPPNEGVGRLAWLTPFVGIVFGIIVIIVFVSR